MKFSSSSSKQILQNPFILYFILAIALGDLLYLSVSGNYAFIAVFMLIGFLASFFSKNMVVILVIAMTTTSIIQFGVKGSINEGMEGEDEEEGMEGEEKEKEEEESFTDKPESEKNEHVQESNPEHEKTIDKVVENQKDLVEKVKKLEPLIQKVESFVARIEKFSDYV